jgi:hypothetical protein
VHCNDSKEADATNTDNALHCARMICNIYNEQNDVKCDRTDPPIKSSHILSQNSHDKTRAQLLKIYESSATSASSVDDPQNSNNITPHKTTTTITLERLHHRFGHIPINVLLSAYNAKIWAPIKIQWEPDEFCISCKIGNICASNRGKKKVLFPSKSGKIIHVDIIYNISKTGLTITSYNPYYLGITDAFLHAYFLVGMKSIDVASVINALQYWSVYYRPRIDYNLSSL